MTKNVRQTLSNPEEIHEWLKRCHLDEYSLETVQLLDSPEPIIRVNVKGDIYIPVIDFKKRYFPVNFGHVSGDFKCTHTFLETLEGAPLSVGGDFTVSYCRIESLQGAPQKVLGHFNAIHCGLTSLEGAPEHVGKTFSVDNNSITSLRYSPSYVGEYFNIRENHLSSLEHFPNFKISPHKKGVSIDITHNRVYDLRTFKTPMPAHIELVCNEIAEINEWLGEKPDAQRYVLIGAEKLNILREQTQLRQSMTPIVDSTESLGKKPLKI